MAKKKKKKKEFKINLISIVFYALALYMVFTIVNQRLDLNNIDNQKQAKIEEKKDIELELLSLQDDLAKINDPEQFLQMVEKIARDEYKMVKPYETVYIDKNKTKNEFNSGGNE
ncbi:MAG: septum formation initiator family protein [Eubacteriales bacterium]|nr:septum formation initiator family protein [Eubacteriales bacterium]